MEQAQGNMHLHQWSGVVGVHHWQVRTTSDNMILILSKEDQ
jgi:hypothetical protein